MTARNHMPGTVRYGSGLEVSHAVALVITLCSAAGCSDRGAGDGLADRILTLDSANAVIIQSTETMVLYGVVDATVLGDGSLVVANSGNAEILVFDLSGSLSNAFGRRGAGPGEFEWLSRVFRHSQDSIVTWDERLRRLSFFDRDGNLGRTVDIGSLADFPSVVGLLSDRFVYRSPVRYVLPRDSVRVTVSGSREPLVTIPNTLSHMVSFERDGQAVSVPHPVVLTPRALVAAGSGVIATGTSDVAEIEVRDADGMLQQTMTLNLPVRAMTQSDRERYIERRRDALASVQRTTASRQRELTILGQTEFAENYPYFDELLIAASGDIWVRGYVAHGDTIATWHVYRPNGEAKGRLTVPSDWSLLHAGSDFLIVRATDELDVEFVTKLSYR